MKLLPAILAGLTILLGAQFASAATYSFCTGTATGQQVCAQNYQTCIGNHPSQQTECSSEAAQIGASTDQINQCLSGGGSNCQSYGAPASFYTFINTPDSNIQVNPSGSGGPTGCFTVSEYGVDTTNPVTPLSSGQCPQGSAYFVNGVQSNQYNTQIGYTPLEPLPFLNGLTSGNTNFGQLLSAIFRILIIGGGLIAVGAFVYGGIVWMTSEAVGSKTAALKRIKAALWGLLLLLAAWIILNTINPQLVTFSNALNPANNSYYGVATPAQLNQFQTDANTCAAQGGTYSVSLTPGGNYNNCSVADTTHNTCTQMSSGGLCITPLTQQQVIDQTQAQLQSLQ